MLSVWPLIEPGRRGALLALFGRLAAVSLALVAVSGATMAWIHLGRLANLVATGYGGALTAKTIVLGDALLLALAGSRAAGDRRTRRWTMELAALVSVLALAGLMVSLPPPR